MRQAKKKVFIKEPEFWTVLKNADSNKDNDRRIWEKAYNAAIIQNLSKYTSQRITDALLQAVKDDLTNALSHQLNISRH